MHDARWVLVMVAFQAGIYHISLMCQFVWCRHVRAEGGLLWCFGIFVPGYEMGFE